VFSKHIVEFDVPGGERVNSLVLRTSGISGSEAARSAFLDKNSSLRRSNRSDKFPERMPDILRAMHDGAADWTAIAQSYGGRGRAVFLRYMGRLRTAGLVHEERLELTEAGAEAAQIFVAEIAIASALNKGEKSGEITRFRTSQKTGQATGHGFQEWQKTTGKDRSAYGAAYEHCLVVRLFGGSIDPPTGTGPIFWGDGRQ